MTSAAKAAPSLQGTGEKPSDEPGDQKGGAASRPRGGTDDVPPPTKAASTQPEVEAADAANLEYARKATDLALQRLNDMEHNPDAALLEKLGWTKDDLAEFLRRWEALRAPPPNPKTANASSTKL